MTALVLSWIVLLVTVSTPWEADYPRIAEAIAIASEGDEQEAAILVSLAYHESRFQIDAVGDHGQSVGLYQISRSNLLMPASVVLHDPMVATLEARRLIAQSWAICKRDSWEYRLGWYAAGGNGCKGRAASKRRMFLAMRLLHG
jgi:hypothetical protein